MTLNSMIRMQRLTLSSGLCLFFSVAFPGMAQNVAVDAVGLRDQVFEELPIVKQGPAQGGLVVDDESLRAFTARAAKFKRADFERSMETWVSEVKKKTGLGDEKKAELEAAANEAVEAAVKAWETSSQDWLKMMSAAASRRTQLTDQTLKASLGSVPVAAGVAPEEQAIWKQRLGEILSGEQMEKWEKELADTELAAKIKFGEAAEANVARFLPQVEQLMNGGIVAVTGAVALDDKRSEQLRALAKEAVDAAQADHLARALREMTKNDKAGTGRVRNASFVNIQPLTNPQDLPIWKDGLARLLTADELGIVEKKAASTDQLRLEAARASLVMLLDERLRLDADQVEVLLKSIDPVAKAVATTMKETTYSLDANRLAVEIVKGKFTPFEKVLEPEQAVIWKSNLVVRPGGFQVRNMRARIDANGNTIEDGAGQGGGSGYEAEQARLMAELQCAIAEIRRACKLTEDQMQMLSFAAKGATQDSLEQLRQGQQGGANSMVIAGNGVVINRRMGAGTSMTPSEQPLWIEAVAQTLDATQHEKLKAVIDQRAARISAAKKKLVIFEADRQCSMSDEAIAFLDRRLDEVFKGPIADAKNDSIGPWLARWYASTSSMVLLPLAFLEDDELKPYLNEDQHLRLYEGVSRLKTMINAMKARQEGNVPAVVPDRAAPQLNAPQIEMRNLPERFE